MALGARGDVALELAMMMDYNNGGAGTRRARGSACESRLLAKVIKEREREEKRSQGKKRSVSKYFYYYPLVQSTVNSSCLVVSLIN